MQDYKAVVHARDVVCCHCGSPNHLTVHHVIPKALKGANTPDNCILLCRDCHRRHHLQEGYPHGCRKEKKHRRHHRNNRR